MPSPLLYIFPLLLSLSSCSQLILSEPFSANSYLNNFRRQCSYTDPGCSNHYSLEPLNGRSMLKISIFEDDSEFSKGSPTDPRTELRSVKNLVQSGSLYSITWDVYIKKYNPEYSFCFLQLFDATHDGPNVMIRWQHDQYKLWADGRNTLLKGSIQTDIETLVTWKVNVFMSSGDNGKIEVFKRVSGENSFESLGHLSGAVEEYGSDQYYLKLGIYTQHNDVKDMDMYIANLKVEKN